MGAEPAAVLFRPGKQDRFFMTDMNADGRADIVRLSNANPYQNEHLVLCTARPRTVDLAVAETSLYELGCSNPPLPALDNRQIYTVGDVDGDGRGDLVRVFAWYEGGSPDRKNYTDYMPCGENYCESPVAEVAAVVKRGMQVNP